jgi:hypothetical protein
MAGKRKYYQVVMLRDCGVDKTALMNLPSFLTPFLGDRFGRGNTANAGKERP